MAEDGTSHPDKRTVSTKAVFRLGCHLWHRIYKAKLMDYITITKSENSGWNSGMCMKVDGRVNSVTTANTNGIILQTIQYKVNGPLVTGRFLKKDKND